ncbi:MAG: hypothetical protein AB1Z98_40365 [Nannocystaceae bacterium]
MAFGISSDGYSSGRDEVLAYTSCPEARCSHQVSVSVVVVEGETLMESAALIYAYGSSIDRPDGAEVWVQWP